MDDAEREQLTCLAGRACATTCIPARTDPCPPVLPAPSATRDGRRPPCARPAAPAPRGTRAATAVLPMPAACRPVRTGSARASPTPPSRPTGLVDARFGDPQLDALIDEALANAVARRRRCTRCARRSRRPAWPMPRASRRSAAGAQYSGSQLPARTVGAGPLRRRLHRRRPADARASTTTRTSGAAIARKWQAAVGQARATEVEAQAARLTLAVERRARPTSALAQAYDALDVAGREDGARRRLLDLGQQRVKAGLDNQLQLRQAAAHRPPRAATGAGRAAADRRLAQRAGGVARARARTAACDHRPTDCSKRAGAALPSRAAERTAGRIAPTSSPRAGGWKRRNRASTPSKAAFYPTINLTALVGLAVRRPGRPVQQRRAAAQRRPGDEPADLRRRPPAQQQLRQERRRLRPRRRHLQPDAGRRDARSRRCGAGGAFAGRADRQHARAGARAAAQGACRSPTQRYRAGLGTQLDVLAAQRTAAAARPATRRPAGRSAARRHRPRPALGGGIATDAPTATASPPTPP